MHTSQQQHHARNMNGIAGLVSPRCGPHIETQRQSFWPITPKFTSENQLTPSKALLEVKSAGVGQRTCICAGKGRADAKAWAKASGALSVVQPGKEKEVPASADQQNEDYSDLEKARPDTNAAGNLPQAAAVQGKVASTKAQ